MRIGHFSLVRTLGRGAMGVVYEAVDPLLGEKVALKTFHRRGPVHLYRLKREFRSLAEIVHPNLVALNDLWVTGDDAYFTMELVHGTDFVSYVREGSAPGERPQGERLRHAFGQLCEGVQALHDKRKLHRDIKPSNVLVTSEGRVVLLDFGLVHDEHEAYEWRGPREGTPGFMAPEVGDGPIGTASDWYSVGVMLRRALGTSDGSLVPESGERATQDADSNLEELALRLVDPDPVRRPGFADIARLLRRDAKARAPRRALPFSGRKSELERLRVAFGRSRNKPVAILVHGDSGVGKTALLEEFARTVLAPAGAVVFRGRCYERESVPYKALDAVMDELGRHLEGLGAADAPALDDEDAAALQHMFPVLGRVPWIARGAAGAGRVHPMQHRARGIAALKALLGFVASRKPCALFIDDLQWADADSGRILAGILCEEDAPRLLLVVADRSLEHDGNPTLRAFDAESNAGASPIAFDEVRVSPLSDDEALVLAREVLGSADDSRALRIVEEARGSPLFVAELARWAAEGGTAPRALVPAASALFDERRERLSESARVVLALLAVAGRPLAIDVLQHAADARIEPVAELRELRKARLVHRLERGDRLLFVIAHDRIAEAVRLGTNEGERVFLHRKLAEAFEHHEGMASEALVEHYAGARMAAKAALCARNSAEIALSALAFSRAERLFERALELGEWKPEDAASLHRLRGIALEHVGRGLDAAESLRRAASLTKDAHAAALLENRAAQHLMHNGEYRRGEAVLADGYGRLGMYWPKSRAAIALSIAFRLLPWPKRRRRKDGSELRELRRVRAEFTAGVGRGIENHDPLRAVHNALVCFHEGERVGDPVWDSRVQSARAMMKCLSLMPGRGTNRLDALVAARDASERLGDLEAQADVERQLSFTLYIYGEVRRALEAANRSEACLRALPLPPLDLHPVMGLAGAALLLLGNLREARRRWTSFIHERRQHRDLMTMTWVDGHPARFALFFAAEDRDGAGAVLERQAHLHAKHPKCVSLAWTHAACKAEHWLYWEGREGAPRRRDAALVGSGYGVINDEGRWVRARELLTVASRLPDGSEKKALLRAARKDAVPRVSRGRLRPAMGQLLEAGIDMQEAQPERAIARLDAIIPVFDAAEARLLAACARLRRGALVGGDEGREAMAGARRLLAEEEIRDPERWIAYGAPGFDGGARS